MNPISPELVLVDPELARLARALLPDAVESNGKVPRAQAQAFRRVALRRPNVGAGAVARSTPPPAQPQAFPRVVARRPIVGAGAVARPIPPTTQAQVFPRLVPRRPNVGAGAVARPIPPTTQAQVFPRLVPRRPNVGAGAVASPTPPTTRAQVFPRLVPRRPIVGAGAVARSTPPTARMPLVLLREAAVAELDAEVEPRQPSRKLLLVGAGLCVFLLGVFIPQVITGGDPAPSEQPRRASVDKQPAAAGPRPAASADSSRDATRQPRDTGIGRAARHTGDVAAKGSARPPQDAAPPPREAPSAQTTREEGAPQATEGDVPTRLFVWLPLRGADYYNVRFLKGTRTVFEAWPTDARVTVPVRGTFRGKRFAFTKGRFRWIVRPAFGPRASARYGAPIVRSVWAVRPESATE
jgi:hypothetical protein